MFPTPVDRLLIGLAVAEAAAFVLFWFDKERAKDHGRRVRETTLLLAAVFGGIGAWFAQHLLRHKTRKAPFRTRLGLIIVVHLGLIAVAVWWALSQASLP